MDKNYCRLCLKQDTWNSPLSVFSEGFDILSKIFLVHGIQIVENDLFSKVICHLCLAKLEFMDGIRKKVAISNSILNGIVGDKAGESRINSEVPTTRRLEEGVPVAIKCSKCEFVTDRASDLTVHLELHKSVAIRDCPRCSQRCVTEDDLEDHMKTKHKGRKLAIHYCPQCTIVIYGTENFNKHCKQHVATPDAGNSKNCAPTSEDVHKSKKKHKKDRVRDNNSKSTEKHRKRIILKISKTASNDGEDSRHDSNGVAKIPSLEDIIQKTPVNIDNSQTLTTNINHSQTSYHTSITNKENILSRPSHPDNHDTTPAKKPRRMSACFVPISPIRLESSNVNVNGLRKDVVTSAKKKSAVAVVKDVVTSTEKTSDGTVVKDVVTSAEKESDVAHVKDVVTSSEKESAVALVKDVVTSTEKESDGAVVKDVVTRTEKESDVALVKDVVTRTEKKLAVPLVRCDVLREVILCGHDSDPAAEETSEVVKNELNEKKVGCQLDKLGANVPVELTDSCDSDLEFDELFTNDPNIAKLRSKWLSDTNGNQLKNSSRKGILSCMGSMHLQSPVVGKLLREASIYLTDGKEKLLDSQLPPTRDLLSEDLMLSEDEWDPVYESQRIYIDVDNDDDVLEIDENRRDQSSDSSCKSFMSLNRQLEEVIEIKDEY